MRRDQPRPFAMEYSRQGQCLVALYENEQADEAAWSSRVTVLDLAAGGCILCRLGDWMCALPTLPLAHGGCAPRQHILARGCTTVGHLRAELRRGGFSSVACTLLDGGSGNEVVTGSVRNGELCVQCLHSSTALSHLRQQAVAMSRTGRA